MRGTRHFTDTLTLVRRETTQAIDPETGSLADTITEHIVWTGKGSIQANSSGKPAIAGTVAGAEEVLVPFKAFLPWDASPQHGWVLRDSLGREFEMVTKPVNPGSAGAYWLLNLTAPTVAAVWVYLSTGLWARVILSG